MAQRTSPAAPEPPAEGLADEPDQDTKDDLRAFIRLQVRCRSHDPEALVEAAAENFDEFDSEEIKDLASDYVDEELADLIAEMNTWPKVTDCDRLDRAFKELRDSRILAEQDYQCCQTCGHAAMASEMRRLEDSGRDVRGYVFYHNQDTDRAVDGGGLYLAFGSPQGDNADSLLVAKEAVRVIRRHGFQVIWDETLEKRIFFDIDWKRRPKGKGPPN